MSFTELSQEIRIPVHEIEHLLMKALSLGLVKGNIDQVDQVVMISWVQPRILDKGQIAQLRDRLADWAQKIAGQVDDLELNGHTEVFAQ
jgi:26S proteasome regulatory subunit N9